MSTRRYRLDSSARRAGGGQVLIAGSPLKLLRLTAAGSRLIDRIGDGEPIAAPQPGAATAALLDRLLDAGIIHPEPSTESMAARDITVVIPAHDAAAVSLQRLVDDCRAGGDVTACVTAVIVVDDASTAPIGPIGGAQVVRRVSNGGPGAARQTGLALVTTPFVAFVDTDVQLPRGWLAPLAA